MIRLGCMLLLSCLLAACMEDDHADLQAWMVENSKDLRVTVPKLPEVKPYEPVPYVGEGQLTPFSSAKVEPEVRAGKGTGKGGLQPDYEAREARNSLLEKYPVESLKMIGFMRINNRPMAAILVDSKVRLLKVGDYIGMDFGMVTAVTDAEVKLKELVQDSAGDWTERESTLLLQAREDGKR